MPHEKDTMVAVRIESVDVELLNVPPNFFKDVGWPGGALCLLALTLAGLHLYIAAEYTFYFQDMHREGIWLFFLFSALFVIMHSTHTDHAFSSFAEGLQRRLGLKSRPTASPLSFHGTILRQRIYIEGARRRSTRDQQCT